MAFVFFLLLCIKGEVLVAILGACLSFIPWHFQSDVDQSLFLNLLCIILINFLSAWSLANTREDFIGFNQILSGCLLLIYSILVVGEGVNPNWFPFRLLIIIFMNWSMAIMEIYSINNTTVELYENESQRLGDN
jgi:hypothetical protein